MDKDVLEVVLKNSTADFSIKRIIDMKWESAVPKGQNFASTIFKIIAKVVLGNGRTAKRSFIAKREKGLVSKPFMAEVLVYTNVLREMDHLMEEMGDTEGPLWCQFIHYSPADSTIIFEDLTALGFSTVDLTEGQSMDHARLSLRSFGRYHAMAKILEQRGIVSKDDYKPHYWFDENFIRNVTYDRLGKLAEWIRDAWGKEWIEAADKLSQISLEELVQRMRSSGTFDDNTFKCLNHGDSWSNNMMFKHDWEGRPIEMRFVDFQDAHYYTPCLDLIYFIYTSMKPDLRRLNYKILVECYHESLTSSLDRFGYTGTKPSLEDINDVMERLSFCMLCFFLGVFALGAYTKTETNKKEEVSDAEDDQGIHLNRFSKEDVIFMIGDDIKKLVSILSD